MADDANDTNHLLRAIFAILEDSLTHQKNMSRDMQALRSMLTQVVNYMVDAESEVPEKMRLFIMYFHDAHDLMNLYHEQGHEPPKWVIKEVERCSDRYRQILEDLYDPNKEGHFEKVRQDMATRGGNRYEWERQLTHITKKE